MFDSHTHGARGSSTNPLGTITVNVAIIRGRHTVITTIPSKITADEMQRLMEQRRTKNIPGVWYPKVVN
jgi:hypothetical protein